MRALVVGIANLETTVPVGSFPVLYEPVRYLPGQLTDRVGGVGFNQARQLALLGSRVRLAAPLGADPAGQLIQREAIRVGIDMSFSTTLLSNTPRSVVLVDGNGVRQINTDLGDALTTGWDLDTLRPAVDDCDLLIVGNLDVNRPVLELARAGHCVAAVDLQAVQGPDNPYDEDFLQADLVVMSGELVGGREAGVLLAMHRRSPAQLMVMTLGRRGSLAVGAGIDGVLETPSAATGPVANTTGAGDSHFASLLHFLVADQLPVGDALRSAAAVAAEFLTRPDRTG